MSSSFHNAEPRSRAERLAAHDKEQRERGMLRTRRGGFQSTSCELGSPVVPEPGSPLWEAEQSRFSGDAAAEIRQQKLEAQRKQQELYERKRQEAQQRESQRWQQMEAERAREEARVTAAREQGLGSKSNQSSEHFNIISLDYHATKEGAQLRYKDDVTRYRAVLRSQNLFNKSHSVPHNIITGELRHNLVELPSAPAPPC